MIDLRLPPLCALMLLLTGPACTASAARSAAANTAEMAQPAAAADLLVQLRRGSCGWRCPQYTLQIDPAGRVLFTGERHVATLEPQQGQLSPAALETLKARLREPAVTGVKDVYHAGGSGCGLITTDMASSDIDWQIDGRAHHLSLYHGCGSLPATLAALPAAIDAAAGSRIWIEQGAER